MSVRECGAECSPLTQLRSCEADCITWRAVGCEFHVPCRHTHPVGEEEVEPVRLQYT